MSSIKTIGGVLVKSNNKVLMCKRSPNNTLPNVWSIPCGHIEKNEPPLVGAKREFFEETNLKLNKINLVGFVNTKKTEEDTLMYVFLHESDDEILPDLENAKDGHEHTECRYFTLKELPKDIDEQFYFIIKKILK